MCLSIRVSVCPKFSKPRKTKQLGLSMGFIDDACLVILIIANKDINYYDHSCTRKFFSRKTKNIVKISILKISQGKLLSVLLSFQVLGLYLQEIALLWLPNDRLG